MSTTQTEIIRNLLSSLEWYIQEEDSGRGGQSEEDYPYWIQGQERAILAMKEAVDFLSQTSCPDSDKLAHRPLVPVPVSVRVPDRSERSVGGSEAWYWDPISGCWFLLPGVPLNNHYTHWLPYGALPNPDEITKTSETNPNSPTGGAIPLEHWHEEDGDVLWWKFPINEPPYVGSPLDTDWPGYHTHFTRIPIPSQPLNNG